MKCIIQPYSDGKVEIITKTQQTLYENYIILEPLEMVYTEYLRQKTDLTKLEDGLVYIQPLKNTVVRFNKNNFRQEIKAEIKPVITVEVY